MAAVMQGLDEIQQYADSDPSTHEDLEQRALNEQRKAFDKIRGREGRRARRRDAAEREGEDEPEDEQDELEGQEDEEHLDEDETDDLDEEEADGGRSRRRRRGEGADLDGALNALRRIDAPDWVFRQKPERIRELAESMTGWQRHHDRALQERDDRIRDLESRTRQQATEESPGADRAVPPEDDLDAVAAEVAGALGIEADADARKALVKFGQRARGSAEHRARRAEQIVQANAGMMDALLVMVAKRELGDAYPQLVSEPEAVEDFQKKVLSQAKTGDYRGKLQQLFEDAALLAFGPPKRRRNGRAGGRNRPVTRTKAQRHTDYSEPGTPQHDRKVFDRIRSRSRSRIASGR